MRALLIEPMLMSRIITPSPAPNSDTRIRARMTGIGMPGPATGMSSSEAGKTKQPERVGRPEPDPPADPRRDDRADHGPDRAGPERQAERARRDAQGRRHVQDEQRARSEGEQVDGRDRRAASAA